MEFDKDLLARQEARELAKAAKKAQQQLARMTQAQLDKIVEAVAKAFAAEAPMLGVQIRETPAPAPQQEHSVPADAPGPQPASA